MTPEDKKGVGFKLTIPWYMLKAVIDRYQMTIKSNKNDVVVEIYV